MTLNPYTNRIIDPGFSYDASGNMTADGLNSMVYDAENRMVSSTTAGATTNYTYDGNSLRLTKQVGGTTTTYLYSGQKIIAEYSNGGLSKEYVYAGSQLIATLQGGSPTYHLRDHLSIRVNTSSVGWVIGEQGHYPFGEQWYTSGTTSNFIFTSYQRDSESGNDNATFRTRSTRFGRFSSSDPLRGSTGQPQSFNRFAYTRNDPVNLTDPLGLCPEGCSAIYEDLGNHRRGRFLECRCPSFQIGGSINGGGGDLYAIFDEKLGGNEDGDDSGTPEQPQQNQPPSNCFAQLRYRPVNHRANKVGITHAFWYVQGSAGGVQILTGGPSGGAVGSSNSSQSIGQSATGQNATLNVWNYNPWTNPQHALDMLNSKAATGNGTSSTDCDTVDALISAAVSFPNDTFRYFAFDGPNSNTAAAYIGNQAGLYPSGPPRAVAWSATFPPKP